MNNALTIHHRPGLLGNSVFDDIFTNILDFPTLIHQSTQGYPVADIYRGDGGETIMEFALAGFVKEDLSVEVQPEKKSITIRADMEKTNGDENIRRIARRSFDKTYVNYDNNLDLSAVNAEFQNGLLRVVVPTRPEAKPLTVKIS